jgi:hypothetical protein
MRTSSSIIPVVLAATVAAQSTTLSSAIGRATPAINNLAVAITDETLTKVRDVMNQLCIYR